MSKLEIYDCTLREGEQAAGASFSLENRVELFRRLDEFGVNYIEVGWPVASKEILEAFELCEKIRKKAKIVAFGSTSIDENPEKDKNLLALLATKADYACIFGKTSKEHAEKQLRITCEENLKRIAESIKFLMKNNMKVFYDAEHYFDAFKDDKEYAIKTLVTAGKAGAKRIILCDTNGGSLPNEVEKIIKETKKRLFELGINVQLGVHFHNDAGLALANTLIALPYVVQVQGTINGVGERIGNLNFSEFLPVYSKKLENNLAVKLEKLKEINEEAYKLGGLEIPEIRAFVGDTAFAHKGGVHIDATSKGASYEHMKPEEIGNRRIIVLNSLGGRAGVISVAKQFGYDLDKRNPDVVKKSEELFEELKKLEEEGYRMGLIPAEQFLLVEKYFGSLGKYFEIEEWKVETGKRNGKEKSEFYVRCRVNSELIEGRLKVEGGPIDAAYKTLSRVLSKRYPETSGLELVDFHVGIARRKAEESTVRTVITFHDKEKFETVGVDANIIQSAIEALTKGFRYYLNRNRVNKFKSVKE